MDDMEKKMIKIGLDILKNNPDYIITNVENKGEVVDKLIEEGEELLKDENIDINNIDINEDELNKIIEMVMGGVTNDG